MPDRDTKQYVLEMVDNEGLAYAMIHYSEFKEYKNEEFHRLRRQFVEAYKELSDYLGVGE